MRSHFVPELTLNGDPHDCVAKLVWADFPTSLGVKLVDEHSVPAWDHFSEDLTITTSHLAMRYTANQGWYVTCSAAKHFPVVYAIATSTGFGLHMNLNLMIDKGYLRTDCHVEVKRCSSLVLMKVL
ncbi:hypothetical protein O6H91_02G122900 [Diphasiastrum complanatum]|uniref:Uncharacterized protein n=1 Tax=Diphasiastrum complanatum TaxID=34168 RepID=A0ACC2EK71_DIPCM|nr:hypothetical protein O6H91_02G122900 [Diphasiastrum complanatum]